MVLIGKKFKLITCANHNDETINYIVQCSSCIVSPLLVLFEINAISLMEVQFSHNKQLYLSVCFSVFNIHYLSFILAILLLKKAQKILTEGVFWLKRLTSKLFNFKKLEKKLILEKINHFFLLAFYFRFKFCKTLSANFN